MFERKENKVIPSNLNEYNILLKNNCIKLHHRYITAISIGIVIWIVATGKANNQEFMNWISFASTVVSIILSVIAIILSITGERKTDYIRNEMQETAKQLNNLTNSLTEENKKYIENLEKNIEELSCVIKMIPEQTAQAVNMKMEKNETSEVVYDKGAMDNISL